MDRPSPTPQPPPLPRPQCTTSRIVRVGAFVVMVAAVGLLMALTGMERVLAAHGYGLRWSWAGRTTFDQVLAIGTVAGVGVWRSRRIGQGHWLLALAFLVPPLFLLLLVPLLFEWWLVVALLAAIPTLAWRGSPRALAVASGTWFFAAIGAAGQLCVMAPRHYEQQVAVADRTIALDRAFHGDLLGSVRVEIWRERSLLCGFAWGERLARSGETYGPVGRLVREGDSVRLEPSATDLPMGPWR